MRTGTGLTPGKGHGLLLLGELLTVHQSLAILGNNQVAGRTHEVLGVRGVHDQFSLGVTGVLKEILSANRVIRCSLMFSHPIGRACKRPTEAPCTSRSA